MTNTPPEVITLSFAVSNGEPSKIAVGGAASNRPADFVTVGYIAPITNADGSVLKALVDGVETDLQTLI